MHNPESLVARVLLKARYFPNSSFFDAQLGYNPSYSWKSLWSSREVLKRGCRWVIGDGSKVKVMGEPWIRGEGGRWMNSPQVEEVYELMMDGESASEDKFVAGRVATLRWNLWQNRNDELWNNTKLSPTQIGHKAHQMWQRWFEANHMRSRSQQDSRMHGITTWTKPREGWIKCNVDAGLELG
ncbi:unnamed protein product [Trifolium pratense]|uniref:Uncharacterized protein n=1 Tax=Trifolium pratense TaxID=57577 RepID=A0ACB0IHV5_TRIPR|nr:unnamed protein product [Trifolium pratense]